MATNEERHGGVAVSHERQVPRLKRIEGQVRGLQGMITDGRDCIEVAHQIEAPIADLRRVQGDMIQDHLLALTEATTGGGLSDCGRMPEGLHVPASRRGRPRWPAVRKRREQSGGSIRRALRAGAGT